MLPDRRPALRWSVKMRPGFRERQPFALTGLQRRDMILRAKRCGSPVRRHYAAKLMKVAAITILAALELVALVVIAKLWRTSLRTSLASRLCWSAVLLVPILGLMLYGLITEEPPEKPGWTDENNQGWGD